MGGEGGSGGGGGRGLRGGVPRTLSVHCRWLTSSSSTDPPWREGGRQLEGGEGEREGEAD